MKKTEPTQNGSIKTFKGDFKHIVLPKSPVKAPIKAIQRVTITKKEGKRAVEAKKEESLNVPEVAPEPKLNPKEELFCYYYAAHPDSYGHGTKAYALAHSYAIDWSKRDRYQKFTKKEIKLYNAAATLSSLMLRKLKILNRCEEVRQQYVGDDKAFFELGWAMLQRKDISSKVRAIELHLRMAGKLIDKSEQIHKHQFIGIIKHVYDQANQKIKENGGLPTEQTGS